MGITVGFAEFCDILAARNPGEQPIIRPSIFDAKKVHTDPN